MPRYVKTDGVRTRSGITPSVSELRATAASVRGTELEKDVALRFGCTPLLALVLRQVPALGTVSQSVWRVYVPVSL